MSEQVPFKFSDQILEKNNQFNIIIKPFGLPTQEDKTKDESLLLHATRYFKHEVHMINRLDRPVGGLVLMANKKSTATFFSNETRLHKVKKSYLAVVKGAPKEKEGTLVNFISKNGKYNKAYISAEANEHTSKCSLDFKLLHTFDNYSLIKVGISSGKFHQIRAQLAHADLPIRGDVKYGARRANKDRSIDLFAYCLEFRHPVTKQNQIFKAPIPEHNGLWKDIKNADLVDLA